MTHLMYNTKDDTLITRAQLHQVVTPPPVGRFHRPVPFGEYVEVVDEALFNACTEALKPTGGHVNMDLVRARSQTAETFISEIIH